MAFPETVRAQLSGREVRLAVLIHLDFRTTPKRIHLGFGPVRAGGFVWQGIGEVGAIAGLEQAISGTAPQATFTLSGVSTDLIAASLAASDEVKGRDVTVFLQFYDANLARLDEPQAVYAGVMDVMSYRVSGPSLATVRLTAESLFARRSKPMWGALSDRDQKRLFPGDRGLEGIARIQNKTAYWPIIVA